jgi:hypothetical protein
MGSDTKRSFWMYRRLTASYPASTAGLVLPCEVGISPAIQQSLLARYPPAIDSQDRQPIFTSRREHSRVADGVDCGNLIARDLL